MRRLIIFNQLSLDGFFADANGDMSWAHKHDAEWNAFAGENAQQAGKIVDALSVIQACGGSSQLQGDAVVSNGIALLKGGQSGGDAAGTTASNQ